MSELLQVVDVVLVSFNVKAKIHASELIELPHVYVISEVISSEVSLLLAMLLDSLQKLLKLLFALKDINLFRFDLFCFSFFQLLSGMARLFTEIGKSLLLKSFLLGHLHHMLLELLAEEEISVVAFRASLRIILHRILLLWLLI